MGQRFDWKQPPGQDKSQLYSLEGFTINNDQYCHVLSVYKAASGRKVNGAQDEIPARTCWPAQAGETQLEEFSSRHGVTSTAWSMALERNRGRKRMTDVCATSWYRLPNREDATEGFQKAKRFFQANHFLFFFILLWNTLIVVFH